MLRQPTRGSGAAGLLMQPPRAGPGASPHPHSRRLHATGSPSAARTLPQVWARVGLTLAGSPAPPCTDFQASSFPCCSLRKALEQLQNVNTVAWGPYLQQPGGKEAGAQQQAQQAEAAAAEPTARSAGGASRARRRLSGVALEQASLLEPLLPGASPAAGQGSTPAAGGSGSGGSGAAPDLEAGQAAAAVRRSSSGPWLVEAEQGAGVAQEEEEEAEQEAHLLQSEKVGGAAACTRGAAAC